MKTIIKNAKIYTQQGIKHSITIEDDKIIGFDEAQRAEQQIDAQGKTIVAGFHDSHMHLLSIGECFPFALARSEKH